MTDATKKALIALLEDETATAIYSHWYDKGEWVEVKVENSNGDYFYLCSVNDHSVRGEYKLGDNPAESIVVDIELSNDFKCILKFRVLNDLQFELRS